MTDTVRVVVVGAGKMGAHHARVFAASRGAVLAGVFDVDHERARRVAAAHHALALRSEEEAIDHADLVVLATPTALHFSQCKRALAAGRHVLVEKPLSESAAEARALCDLARDRDVRLLVGHSERFNPVVRAIARASRGETIVRITTRRTSQVPARACDVCLNLAVHDIDLFAFLSGHRVELESAWGSVNETVITLRGGTASARVSVGRSDVRERTLHVHTNDAAYAGDLLARKLSRNGVALAVDPHEPLALQALEALASIAGRTTTVASGEDGTHAVALATGAACRLAAEDGDSRVAAAE